MEDLALAGIFGDLGHGDIGGGTWMVIAAAVVVVVLLFMSPGGGSAAGRAGGMRMGWLFAFGGGTVLLYLLYLAVRG